jgi:hypothetical protein
MRLFAVCAARVCTGSEAAETVLERVDKPEPEQGQQATQGMGSGGGLALVFWYGALVGVRPVCELVRLSASLSVEFYTCNIKPKTKLVQYLRSTCTGTCTGFGGSGPARPCTLWSNLA